LSVVVFLIAASAAPDSNLIAQAAGFLSSAGVASTGDTVSAAPAGSFSTTVPEAGAISGIISKRSITP